MRPCRLHNLSGYAFGPIDGCGMELSTDSAGTSLIVSFSLRDRTYLSFKCFKVFDFMNMFLGVNQATNSGMVTCGIKHGSETPTMFRRSYYSIKQLVSLIIL